MTNLKQIIANLSSIRLLYVEDDTNTREMTLEMLKEFFTHITVAVNGEDALLKFQEACKTTDQKFDLVIADIYMPNMDGIEMSRRIRLLDEEISIIMLTALTDIVKIKEAIEIGIDSFINKPLNDIEVLLTKIDTVTKKMQNKVLKQQNKVLLQEKEKIELVFRMIHNISHHWKQPLSVISMIAGNHLYQEETSIKQSSEDKSGALIIMEEVNKLSEIINKIEQLKYNEISLTEIEKLISICSPIYKNGAK